MIDDPALVAASKRINARGKRMLDLGLGVLALCFLLPFILTIWVVLRVSRGGPALLRTASIGRRGRSFTLLGFASRGRGTRAAYRENGLHRLPALVNVIAGDLSLVGPPPVDRAGLEAYGSGRRYYLLARPGLISPWRAGEAATAQRCRDYVLNWRLRNDVATAWSALAGRRRIDR